MSFASTLGYFEACRDAKLFSRATASLALGFVPAARCSVRAGVVMRVCFLKRQSPRTPLVTSWTPPYNYQRSCDHPEVQIDSPFPALWISFLFFLLVRPSNSEPPYHTMEVPTATSLRDIYPEDALPVETKRWESLLTKFKDLYGKQADFVARSPGRVNIIGEVNYLQTFYQP